MSTAPIPIVPILELRKATKKYAGVPAIEDVDFALMPGEVHAIVGENGAGKSTLTKVMAGVVTLSSGEMRVEGRVVNPQTPYEARELGIAMVFQETSLVPTMTVAQNLFLGQEHFFNRLRGIYIAAQQFMQSLQFDVDPTAQVSLLGAAKKQMVEIARAVLHKARVIIFDEPTASLTPEEKKYFFDLIANLKSRGVSVIFISHALEEALQVSDRITILRDGRHVVTDDTAKFDRDRIVQAMVGRDLSKTLYGQRKSHVRPQGKRVLSVQNLRMAAMVKNNSCRCSRARSPAFSALSARAAPRPSRWWRVSSSATSCTGAKFFSTAARCVISCPQRRCVTASPMSRRIARSRVFSRPSRSLTTSTWGCWPSCAGSARWCPGPRRARSASRGSSG
jgi:simple sugar transport system ATP-binding protein